VVSFKEMQSLYVFCANDCSGNPFQWQCCTLWK